MKYRELESIVAELEQLKADMNDIYCMAENCRSPRDLLNFALNLTDYADIIRECVLELIELSDNEQYRIENE